MILIFTEWDEIQAIFLNLFYFILILFYQAVDHFGRFKIWFRKKSHQKFQLKMNNTYIDSVWDQIMVIRNKDKKVIRQTLIGQKIATNYNHGATYIIADILWDKNPKITFPDPKNHNQEMSFAKYFKRKYGLEIKDMEQPMIVGMDKCSNLPILLVPELCFSTDVSNTWK